MNNLKCALKVTQTLSYYPRIANWLNSQSETAVLAWFRERFLDAEYAQVTSGVDDFEISDNDSTDLIELITLSGRRKTAINQIKLDKNLSFVDGNMYRKIFFTMVMTNPTRKMNEEINLEINNYLYVNNVDGRFIETFTGYIDDQGGVWQHKFFLKFTMIYILAAEST